MTAKAGERNIAGLPLGGSTGDVLTKTSDDDLDTEWGAGGGGAPALHGAFYYLNNAGLLVAQGGVIAWDHAAYDTDGYSAVDLGGRLNPVIPVGLGGIYLIEATVYLSPASDANPGLDRPYALITEPSDSCDIQFDRKNPDSNAPFDPSWWYGSGSFVRPLSEGDTPDVSISGVTSNVASQIFVYGGTSQTMMSLTKLYDLPNGYVSPF